MPPKKTDLSDKLAKSKIESSDESPDSSDSEYGAKTLLRKVFSKVKDHQVTQYRSKSKKTQEVNIEEIQANPEKYYIANFRGDRLDYFENNLQRRQYVKTAVEASIKGSPPSYKSIAAIKISAKYKEGSEEYNDELKKIDAEKKVTNTDFIRTYKSPTYFQKAVTAASPVHGNPLISTSKDSAVTVSYADHAKKDAKLHPKYNEKKKPKHRLIGMETVFIHKATDYITRPKADIERLRSMSKIGGKAAVERDNEEIIFADEVKTENIAGYIPLVYPNLSKTYNSDDEKLFGLDKKNPTLTRKDPKTLGDSSKTATIYELHRDLQWQVAEAHIKKKNPQAELLWVGSDGKFYRFSSDEKTKNVARKLIKATEESESEEELDRAADEIIADVEENIAIVDESHDFITMAREGNLPAIATLVARYQTEREILRAELESIKKSGLEQHLANLDDEILYGKLLENDEKFLLLRCFLLALNPEIEELLDFENGYIIADKDEITSFIAIEEMCDSSDARVIQANKEKFSKHLKINSPTYIPLFHGSHFTFIALDPKTKTFRYVDSMRDSADGDITASQTKRCNLLKDIKELLDENGYKACGISYEKQQYSEILQQVHQIKLGSDADEEVLSTHNNECGFHVCTAIAKMIRDGMNCSLSKTLNPIYTIKVIRPIFEKLFTELKNSTIKEKKEDDMAKEMEELEITKDNESTTESSQDESESSSESSPSNSPVVKGKANSLTTHKKSK